jgi:hypothetical protein
VREREIGIGGKNGVSGEGRIEGIREERETMGKEERRDTDLGRNARESYLLLRTKILRMGLV